jgi:hypothetical protein
MFCLIQFGMAFANAYSEEPVVSGIFNAPVITWTATQGRTYFIEKNLNLNDEWQQAGIAYAKSNHIARWVDSTTVPGEQSFYRIAAKTNASNNGFYENFEDEGGWTDKAHGTWTVSVSSGSWQCPVGKLAAVTHPSRARSGTRFIQAGDNEGRLMLPVTDNPTQLVYWARATTDQDYGYIYTFYFDGVGWSSLKADAIRSLDYQKYTIPLNLGQPNPGQLIQLLFYLPSGGGIYFDDVELQASPY